MKRLELSKNNFLYFTFECKKSESLLSLSLSLSLCVCVCVRERESLWHAGNTMVILLLCFVSKSLSNLLIGHCRSQPLPFHSLTVSLSLSPSISLPPPPTL